MSISYAAKKAELQSLGRSYPNRARIRRYFRHRLDGYGGEMAPCLFLPSLMELAGRLGASSLDIQCALCELRKEGYDFFSLGPYNPITLWHPSRICLLSE